MPRLDDGWIQLLQVASTLLLSPLVSGAIARAEAIVQGRRRCVLCGACVAHDPRLFSFVADYETAFVRGTPLGDHSRTLRRSIHIRHVDAGSDGAEEWEVSTCSTSCSCCSPCSP